ncbi:synthase [Nesidiocoris tenuis]|uniref:Synthase n=1 Tax=Nesidiocoris tenuis TaxID=355587 RepID=A0ABN7A8J3_9HEMI|nr:synthase [Nesidiocoris tenuis]
MTVYKKKLIVVSNRLPFVIQKDDLGNVIRKHSAGGLVTAVAPVVVENDGKWVGWPGPDYDFGEPLPESSVDDTSPTAGLKSSNVIPVALEPHLYQSYYNGCCNETFWPLFHSMPDKAVFSADYWKAYVEANELFARNTIKALENACDPDDPPLVWIHDYHLMLAAHAIRQYAANRQYKIKLGFFLHIPFPAWDLIRLFPWADEILQGMLACDLVGMHLQDYCINFIDCCSRGLGTRVDAKDMIVEHGGRYVRIAPLPIGIPYDRFRTLAVSAKRTIPEEKKVVLGVDRLDYTKGLPQRLKAFELLLAKHPEYIEKLEMLQIAVPSRTDVKEYQDLKEQMDQLVGCINGRFSTPTWSPIRYIYGTVSQQELAAFYRDAAVCFVTPLRDGMNLVAKEFVACQINDPPGVLIVSPFAGAGQNMLEALLCNPYELNETMETLHRALTMPEDERTLRMNYLRKREQSQDVDFWMKSFLRAIGRLDGEEAPVVQAFGLRPLSLDDFDDYFAKCKSLFNQKLALLLDYDGTLAPLASHPDLATIPSQTKELLQRLSNIPDVYVAIVSGRAVSNVKEMVGVENITYAGSHGLQILHPDGTQFHYPMPPEFEEKASEVLKELQDQVCKDGAWVESKGVYLTFHYRNVPADAQAELVAKAKEIIEKHGFLASHAHAAIEAKPPINWNKGRASIYILRTAFGLDWSERVSIIYAGDDTTDEDAFQALKGMAFTFRITQNDMSIKTAADRRLTSTNCVFTLLQWVERYYSSRPISKPA